MLRMADFQWFLYARSLAPPPNSHGFPLDSLDESEDRLFRNKPTPELGPIETKLTRVIR